MYAYFLSCRFYNNCRLRKTWLRRCRWRSTSRNSTTVWLQSSTLHSRRTHHGYVDAWLVLYGLLVEQSLHYMEHFVLSKPLGWFTDGGETAGGSKYDVCMTAVWRHVWWCICYRAVLRCWWNCGRLPTITCCTDGSLMIKFSDKWPKL